MTKKSLFSLLALAALGLCSCGPSVDALGHASFEQAEFEQVAASMNEEARAVVEHYRSTRDARHASPTYGITLLHLAAMTHRIELVKQLLAEGADPNALMKIPSRRFLRGGGDPQLLPAAPPLFLATRYNVSNAYSDDGAQDALHVARVLAAHGADLNYHDPAGLGVLATCGFGTNWGNGNWEKCALSLLDMGAKPTREDMVSAADKGAFTLLKRLLAMPEGQPHLHDHELMQELGGASFFMRDNKAGEDKGWLDCVKLVLDESIDVNARDEYGRSLLGDAADDLSFHDEEDEAGFDPSTPYVQYLLLLLKHGADPYAPYGEADICTPADYFARSPRLLATFAEQGFAITPPPHRFTREHLQEELGHLPFAAVRDEEVREHWDALASALTAPAAEEAWRDNNDLDEETATKAVQLMSRADAPRLAATMMERPCWQADSPAWKERQGEPIRWLRALYLAPQAVFPADWLASTARHAEAAGNAAAARLLVLMLERCPADETAALLEGLCAEETPLALRAAAWTVRLKRENLPTIGGQGELTKWFASHVEGCADPYWSITDPSVQLAFKVDAALGHEAFECPLYPFPCPYCRDERNREDELDALYRLSPLAAKLYEKGKDEATDDEKVAALLELELAYSQHVWVSRQDFRKPELRSGR